MEATPTRTDRILLAFPTSGHALGGESLVRIDAASALSTRHRLGVNVIFASSTCNAAPSKESPSMVNWGYPRK
jgi:hypothetical protein